MTGIRGEAVLFSEMTPRAGNEGVFNAWYDNHHMPNHVKDVPLFISGQRYKSEAGPHYLAVYELVSTEALESEEYRTYKFSPDPGTKAVLDSVTGFTRYIGVEESFRSQAGSEAEGINANVIRAEFYAVPFDNAPEFNEWYDDDYVPMLLQCPDWIMARRLSVVDSDPERYSQMMLHYLNDAGAVDSDAVKRAMRTDRYSRFLEEHWFLAHTVSYRRRGERVLKTDD